MPKKATPKPAPPQQAENPYEPEYLAKYPPLPITHLRDVLAALIPLGEDDTLPSPATRQYALNLALDILCDSWKGPYDREAVESYIRGVSLWRSVNRIKGGNIGPVSSDPDKSIDDEIRRLHGDGLTAKLVGAICEKYPDVAKATGLDQFKVAPAPKPADGTPDAQVNPPRVEKSRPMPLTELATRIFKDPTKTRKLKSVYSNIIEKVGDKSWTIELGTLPPNIRKELERP
jgi:hypothetical protein